MFAALSDDDLLRRSELIVIGRWAGITPAVPGAAADAPTLAHIEVSEVLRGPAGLQRAAVAVPRPGTPVSGNDLPRRVGEHGLWLLRLRPGGPDGVYLADHPQRFVPASDTARIDALRRRILAR